MSKHNEKTIAHMSMIQGVITLLETNCFTLKALAMTLAVAILAFIGTLDNPMWAYPLVGYLPIVVFWIMDAKYLQLGRRYRNLFEMVRGESSDLKEEFTMNINTIKDEVDSTIAIAFSWSIMWFYLSILSTFTLVIYCTYSS